ncbi:hypothetical protein QR680_004018 [Steinernema hermaphroditum]|uniref:Cytosolic fatty-acid binding proteins domain-containing protein n=1 Tax=Steinernema hermaphroditum TaxID=289476 RepID=A0AA39HME4_9BILA|nr:hypothetical protein QR680_004018 [Steinernema hermaphroditum]
MKLFSIVILVVVASVIQGAFGAQTLPEKFYGKFDHDHSDNFEEYLIAKDYGWFMRKMILLASVTKVFEKGTKPNTFRFKNLTSKKDTDYDNVELGKTFENEGLDSEQHKITFEYNPSTGILSEIHLKIGDSADKTDTYKYRMEGDFLAMEMTWKGVSCTRYYKRV